MTTHSSIPAAPPYALATPAFRFRALALFAGRAPIGGPREVALAMYLAARLVDDCLPARMLPAAARAERASAARTWLASITLTAPIRTALAQLIEATAGEAAILEAPLASAIAAVEAHLDNPSRSELQRLKEQFRS